MKLSHPIRTLLSAVLASALSLFLLEGASAAPVVAKPNRDVPVKITDNGATWTLDNGIVERQLTRGRHSFAGLSRHRNHQ